MDWHESVSSEYCLSELNSPWNPFESIANALATGVYELG
jgi:hypothetical protein